MTVAPQTTVTVFFGETSTASTTFILDDPVQGVLNSATYTLGGDQGTNVSGYVVAVSVQRGRSGLIFDEIDAGTATVTLNNETRLFDPLYAAGTHYGDLKPGKRVVIATAGVTIFDGQVSDWDLQYEVSGRSIAVMKCEDALAVLARKQFLEWTTTGSQAAGARYDAVLNRSEVAWPGGARDIDTGVSTLQADLVTWGSSVLNYCQLVARSDFGSFYCSRTGVLTFKDRHANLTGGTSIAYGGAGIPVHGIGIQSGSETFYTRVTVDREGGTAQTYTTTEATTDGIRSLALSGLLMDSDAQALNMATYLGQVYASGEAIVSMVETRVNADQMTTAQIATALGADIASLAAVTYTPNNVGAAIAQTCVVIGVEHDIVPGLHAMRLWLGKYDSRQPFILDDPVLGVLTTGPGVLTF